MHDLPRLIERFVASEKQLRRFLKLHQLLDAVVPYRGCDVDDELKRADFKRGRCEGGVKRPDGVRFP